MVKCAVIGCGLMGSKIAGTLACYGHRVKVHDSSVDALNSIYKRIEEDRKELMCDKLILDNFPGQILCMSRLEETVEDAEFVFEAAIEDLSIKVPLFEKIGSFVREDAIVCSNTLRLDVNTVLEKVPNLERAMGLRFLFPVYYVPEVEITPTRSTSAQAIEKVRLLLENMGKTLFYRSGPDPLILTEEDREERKRRRAIEVSSFGLSRPKNFLPHLPQNPGGINPRASFGDESHLTSWLGGSLNQSPECAICLDRYRDCVLAPCHHLILCNACAQLLFSRQDFCPVCRQQIKDVIKVYHS